MGGVRQDGLDGAFSHVQLELVVEVDIRLEVPSAFVQQPRSGHCPEEAAEIGADGVVGDEV